MHAYGAPAIFARGYFEEGKDLSARILGLIALEAVCFPRTPRIAVNRGKSVEILDNAECLLRAQKEIIV